MRILKSILNELKLIRIELRDIKKDIHDISKIMDVIYVKRNKVSDDRVLISHEDAVKLLHKHNYNIP